MASLAEAAEASQTLPQTIIQHAKNYAKGEKGEAIMGQVLDLQVRKHEPLPCRGKCVLPKERATSAGPHVQFGLATAFV